MKRGKLVLLSLIIILATFQIAAAACVDEDGDGYGTGCANELDCNDNNPAINPGATELCGNSIDDNCNGEVDEGCGQCTDADRDGYNATNDNCGIADCDDSSSFVNPGMDELCDNGIDDNCDGNVDSGDPGCVPETPEEECHLYSVYWADCSSAQLSSAKEGDSVYLIAIAQNCPDTLSFGYKIYEQDAGSRALVDELSEEYYLEDTAYDLSFWAAKWDAAWEADDEADADPEYVFDATMEGGEQETMASGQLKVEQCPSSGPDCAEVCELEDFIRIGLGEIGGGGGGFNVTNRSCLPDWDCSAALWSECDAETRTKTRDTSLCAYTGSGNPERCAELYRATVTAEASCIPQGVVEEEPARTVEKKLKKAAEEVSEFPWTLILIIGLAAVAVAAGAAYFIKKKTKAKAAKASPFKSEKDLESVANYIKAAKAKGYKDAQISETLKKGGWKDEHISYAMKAAEKKK